MTSTLGGDDPAHDFAPEEKDTLERELTQVAEGLRRQKKHKERKKKLDRAREISRQKAKRPISEETVFTTLQVRAQQADIQEYQDSLRADWSKKTLRHVLALLWRLIADGAKPSDWEWRRVLECSDGTAAGTHFNEHIVESIQHLAEAFTDPDLPPMPVNLLKGVPRRSAVQAEKTWAYLVLQAAATLKGEAGVFRDSQSLLFFCAIHHLLPELKKQGFVAEHDCLVQAMYLHTLLVWRDRPDHQFYLQSVLMDYLGLAARRLELLQASLHLTPVEDHCYPTTAYALWCDLLDAGENKKALDLLLFLNKVCPPSFTDQITEMIAETLHLRIVG